MTRVVVVSKLVSNLGRTLRMSKAAVRRNLVSNLGRLLRLGCGGK